MAIVLNRPAVAKAQALIASGDYDSKSPWAFTFEDRKRVEKDSTFFLAEELEDGESLKWQYPIGKGSKLYASALRNAVTRAEINNHEVIKNEAQKLLAQLTKSNVNSKVSPRILEFSSLSFLQLRQKKNETDSEMDIFGVIGDSFWGDGVTQRDFSQALKELPKTCKSCTLNINSPGGDAFEGRAIANMIRNSSIEFHVNIIGEASSAASIIAMAGETIHMSEGSLMLIHRCYTLALGNSIELAKVSSELNTIDQEAAQTYNRKTGMDKDDIIALMDENRYMTSKEAKEKGFVDTIDNDDSAAEQRRKQLAQFMPFSVAALSDLDRKRMHLPSLPETSRPNTRVAMDLISNIRG